MNYARRLSTTEVKEGFILILKDKVKLFPESGRNFTLRIGSKEFTTQLKEIPCTCQGPDEPHVHWHLDASGFVHLLTGSRPNVSISKIDERVYELQVSVQKS